MSDFYATFHFNIAVHCINIRTANIKLSRCSFYSVIHSADVPSLLHILCVVFMLCITIKPIHYKTKRNRMELHFLNNYLMNSVLKVFFAKELTCLLRNQSTLIHYSLLIKEAFITENDKVNPVSRDDAYSLQVSTLYLIL